MLRVESSASTADISPNHTSHLGISFINAAGIDTPAINKPKTTTWAIPPVINWHSCRLRKTERSVATPGCVNTQPVSAEMAINIAAE